MISETIKLLQSNKWYGCSETIEIAKGKNSIPKRWDDVKEQVARRKHIEINKGRKRLKEQFNKLMSWLLRKK